MSQFNDEEVLIPQEEDVQNASVAESIESGTSLPVVTTEDESETENASDEIYDDEAADDELEEPLDDDEDDDETELS